MRAGGGRRKDTAGSGPPVALTIAGSDSGAGAGIQADLKAMAASGVFATTVITTVTAQNTVTVAGVHHVPVAFVEAQLDAVLDDFPVAATKTGMLGTLDVIEMVARRAAKGDLANLVVDPVMVASTGQPLLDEGGISAYCRSLLPHAMVVTPNLYEAALLTDTDPADLVDLDSMVDVARQILTSGPQWVLVKGGHLAPARLSADGPSPLGIYDVLASATTVTTLPTPYIDTPNTHGTGCSLSAAIAARLATGIQVAQAVEDAKEYVHRALVGAAPWRLGNRSRGPRPGHGPLDHFGWSAPDPGGPVALAPNTTVTGP
jgi:hydroxymethylpyrimidine/phosphomethylpyrimidine kinase